jgi:replicative DNA helicase
MNEGPHDTETEKAVLGALMMDNNAVWRVRSRIRPADFFGAALALAEHGQPVDPVTLKAQLEREGTLAQSGGIGYIAELSIFTPTAANVEHYAAIVEDFALRRRMIAAAEHITRQANDLMLSPEALRAESERELLHATTLEGGDLLPLFGAGWPEFIAETAVIMNNGQVVTGVPFGFSRLDYLLQGMQPGDLITLAASTSVGKTSFAFQVAMHAASKGFPVLAFSLETKERALRYRISANASRLDSLKLRQGATTPQERERLLQRIRAIEDYPIRIDTRTPVTVSQIRNRARLLHAKGMCQLLVVDYAQFLVRQQSASRQDRRSRNEQVEEATGALKQIAMELEIPVLLLSQVTRESVRDNRAPQLHDLRDSGGLEQDSDVVIFLHRPGKGVPEDDMQPRDVDLIVAKNRNGPVRDIRLHWYPALTRFEEPKGTSITPGAQQQSMEIAP